MADTLIREGIAYGSQPLSPTPQYWDGSTGYTKVQGVNGAIRAILFDSAGETFTDASPGSVTVVSSAGGSAVFNSTSPGIIQVALSAGGSAAFSNAVPGTVQLVTSAGATNLFSGSNPGSMQLTSTATIAFSATGTVEILSSAGGTAYFSTTKPAGMRIVVPIAAETLYTATITWTSGTTATSAQTLSVGILTANFTTATIELVLANSGPYAVTANVYKVISANATTFTTSAVATFIAPAEIVTADVTINAGRVNFAGLFNFNTGITIRLTVTASFTASVTNSVIIKNVS